MSTPHISCLTLLYISKWVHSTYHVQRCCTYKHEHTARITGLFRCRVFVRCCSANNSCKQQYYWCCNMSRGALHSNDVKLSARTSFPCPLRAFINKALGSHHWAGVLRREPLQILSITRHTSYHAGFDIDKSTTQMGPTISQPTHIRE